MINLKNLKPSKPKVDMSSFVWLLSGNPKSGKTSLAHALAKKYLGGPEKVLLLAFEKGYQTLNGIYAQDINNWGDFEDVVKQLVKSRSAKTKKEDRLSFEFIVFDTVDIAWDMATKEVIRKYNIKHGKNIDDISGIPYGGGYEKVKELVREQVDKLIKAGYGIMIITHSKERKVEQRDGTAFDTLQLSIPNKAREVFVNSADFILFITMEKEKNEDGEVETKREIYWRTDGYVEAGSRFRNVPEKIPYDVDIFIKTFEEAVKSEIGEDADVESLRKEQFKEREEEAQKFIENDLVDIEELKDKLWEKIDQEIPQSKKKDLAKELKDAFGNHDIRKYTSVEQLKGAEEIIKQYLS